MPVLRVRTLLTGSIAGGGQNLLYFGGSGSSDAASAHAAVSAFWNSIKTYMHTSIVATVEGEVAELDTASGQPVDMHAVDLTTYTGTNTNSKLPAATEGLLRFMTGAFYDGRERRGRIFVPGPCADVNQGGDPTVTYRTALQTAGALLGSSQVVYHRPTTPTAGDGAFDLVIGRSAWNKFAVLRSRRD